MRIVVLDALPANPGDISWTPLQALGSVELHDGTPPSLVDERIAGADVIVTNKVRIERQHIERAGALKLICVLATGYDAIDVGAAKDHGVVVSNVPGYAAASTAQLAIALLLELTHHVGDHSVAVHAGRWSASPTFAFWDTPQLELDGLTMVIVGLGDIGGRVASIAEALGMRVVAAGIPGRTTMDPVRPRVPLNEALATADVVSLHCPLTTSTRHLFDAPRLALLRPHALLINTGRGPLVDEHAVADALRAGTLGGYGSDVLSAEPPSASHPLFGAPRCVLTPHLAWGTAASRARLLGVVADNIAAFARGEPTHVVS